jgi:hypothetical protein
MDAGSAARQPIASSAEGHSRRGTRHPRELGSRCVGLGLCDGDITRAALKGSVRCGIHPNSCFSSAQEIQARQNSRSPKKRGGELAKHHQLHD